MRTSISFAVLLFSLLASAVAGAAEQTRPMPPFTGVSAQGPVNMIVEVGKTQSLVLKGDDKFLKRVMTKVVDGKLVITFPKTDKHEVNSDSTINIAMPTLSSFNVEGAGSVELKNINGDKIDIGFQGAGRLVATGKVRQLKLNAQGVGDVDTKALLAQEANVNFEGIGAVKVYASQKLDATVQGMGSLNYYGNPRTVRKQVDGIGSVKAGD
ncbi:head GIN domain-containing protein [Massilia sp. TSP1-1-2]|uniref:head GIN domain-containing protein n=1 Tax=Massilia sp. TSP1-1-2 TaxID=2804649 RepID=UPI003CECE73F